MNQTDAIVLILRQLEGTLSPDDQQALDRWLSQNPEHEAVRTRVRKLHGADWSSLQASPTPTFLMNQLETLQHQAADTGYKNEIVIRIAAVITLVILASVFVYFTARPDTAHRVNFSRTELRHVAETLEREYMITIRLDDPNLNTLQFTGMFVNAPADDILAALYASLPITFERHGDSYILKERKRS